MDQTRFKQILSTFVDSVDQFEIKRGTLVVQMGSELISAELRQRADGLFIEEDGVQHRAEQWIVRRLAQLDLLAERILSSVPSVTSFVIPKADILETINESPLDQVIESDSAVDGLTNLLDRRPAGTCSVIYLTSDAGEGKTTLINRLAHQQAEGFRKRQTDWLLVPIALGGRPFLRFEDVVVAALMNQLRFQRLYFDAFVELVRMGVIIPALDGFEEVFVETSDGDAVSSLGTLIRQMSGDGSLLIAARKAYFEYRRLETQVKLLDALPDVDVAFSRVRLRRWKKEEFVTYAILNGIREGARLYSEITNRVSEDHPLVTRPVLIKRLVEIAQGYEDFSFIASIRPETGEFFLRFIDKILEREATQKWIDKLGDPPSPLLTVEEHHQLLGYISEEMWISKAGVLSAEMLDSMAELIAESLGKSPVIARQIRERVKQHALIVASSTNRKDFLFDHDNFREFFLGEQLGWHMLKGRPADLRKLMRVDIIQEFTFDTAISLLETNQADWIGVLTLIHEVARSEGPSSYVRENAGGVVIRVLERIGNRNATVEDLVFSGDALQGRAIHNVEFKRCYFRPTSLGKATLLNCKFIECEFERLEVEGASSINGVVMGRGTVVRTLGVLKNGEASEIYEPRRIADIITQAGFATTDAERQLDLELDRATTDPRLAMLEKALHAFQRSTQINRGTFRLRLSLNANAFFDQVFPDLLSSGVLEEVTKGPARDRFKLGIPFGAVVDAITRSEGSYERCLGHMRTHRKV